MNPGNEIDVDPIPPVEENTTWFEAGPLAIGVEYRVLDDALLLQEYPDGIPTGVSGVDDSGVSLHVVDTKERREYLRFDCFDEEPHYHYLLPGQPVQRWVPFDAVANGAMLDWALERLRTRLPEMLVTAGGPELSGQVDPVALSGILGAVEAAARSGGGIRVDPHAPRRG
ncbi:MAG: hypothetical protein M0Z30_04605 [Actinomycetota bacterium]|nr:hypothetical protein [Actinomycetota bacterium]